MIKIIKIRENTHHKLKVFAAENGTTVLDIADKVLLDFFVKGSETMRKKVVREIKEG